jgi:cytochrome c oxidase assembly protein subunit 11
MSHFNKLECFCFQEHVCSPGESRQWPVAFVLDPKLPEGRQDDHLSYTFFEVGGKVPAAPAGGGPVAGALHRDGGVRPRLRRVACATPSPARAPSAGTLKAVGWSFFGVRKAADLERTQAAEPAARDHRRRSRRRRLRSRASGLVSWVLSSGVAR